MAAATTARILRRFSPIKVVVFSIIFWNSSGWRSSLRVMRRWWVVVAIRLGSTPPARERAAVRAGEVEGEGQPVVGGDHILYLKSSGDIFSRISDHLSRDTLARF